jgi:hypothetical protein
MKRIIISISFFAVFSLFCLKAEGCPIDSSGRAAEAQMVKDHPEMAQQMQEHWNGCDNPQPPKVVTTKTMTMGYVLSIRDRNLYISSTPKKENIAKTVKKEEVFVPISTQAAYLRKFSDIAQNETNDAATLDALKKCFEAHKARIVYETCQSQKNELEAKVSDSFAGNKNLVVKFTTMIAEDHYKRAVADFYRLRSNQKVRSEMYKISLRPINVDANSGIDEAALLSCQFKINSAYVSKVPLVEKFSADTNNVIKNEAVRIFSSLVEETEPLNLPAADLPTVQTEIPIDANSDYK